MADSMPRMQFDLTKDSVVTFNRSVRMICIEDKALLVRVYANRASPESIEAVGCVLRALVEEIKNGH